MNYEAVTVSGSPRRKMQRRNRNHPVVYRWAAWLLLIAAGASSQLADAGQETAVPRITVARAGALLGSPDTVIIDVRTDRTWWRSKHKIRGAVHENPYEVSDWADNYSKNQTLIFYCA
jgi:hypothetical protein